MDHPYGIWDAVAAAVLAAIICAMLVWARQRSKRLERLENARRNRVCRDWMNGSSEHHPGPFA